MTGKIAPGVYAKDLILKIIAELGVKGGIGYAYEYGGPTIESLSMESCLTVCNMSIEGGARFGYICPDEVTFDYLKGKRYAPKNGGLEQALRFWKEIASDADADYDDVFELDVNDLAPMVAWGINPGQAVGVNDRLPRPDGLPPDEREVLERAYAHTGFTPDTAIAGQRVDVAFIGSCTNARLGDLREAAKIVKGRRVSSSVRALVVPGSMAVAKQAVAEGLDEVFRDAGFQWRNAGCSMCLAINPDVLNGREICASSSNRNFIGRQGSPTGRTLLISPAMVAAAALTGEVTDIREIRCWQR